MAKKVRDTPKKGKFFHLPQELIVSELTSTPLLIPDSPLAFVQL